VKTVAVVGAGIVGRCCALALARSGCAVTLFDKTTLAERQSASFVAAGMLAPLSEATAHGSGWFYQLARDAVERWRELIASLSESVFLTDRGSLIGARPADRVELEELQERLKRLDPGVETQILPREELRALEPDLAEGLEHGLLIPGEGAVNGTEAMDALASALRPLVTVRENRRVESLAAYRVDGEAFDQVVDCRGLGARNDLKDLRGVRGELVELYAPELHIQRPTRVPHARYPVYIVPRGQGRYVVGATAIESDDDGPPGVTSILELLSAVYGLSPGFRQAGVTRLAASVRPAFFDNMPQVRVTPGLMRVNGLFRHGFMLAPAIAEAVASHLTSEDAPQVAQLFRAGERIA
jgi:glycine oxidase